MYSGASCLTLGTGISLRFGVYLTRPGVYLAGSLDRSTNTSRFLNFLVLHSTCRYTSLISAFFFDFQTLGCATPNTSWPCSFLVSPRFLTFFAFVSRRFSYFFCPLFSRRFVVVFPLFVGLFFAAYYCMYILLILYNCRLLSSSERLRNPESLSVGLPISVFRPVMKIRGLNRSEIWDSPIRNSRVRCGIYLSAGLT